MHADRHFGPTQTTLLRHASRLIGLLIVVIGAAACSSPAPANAVEVSAVPATTERVVPSPKPEPLRTAGDLDPSDSGAVVLENLPIVPNDGTTLLELAAPQSAPSRWLLAHIDKPNTVAFSRSRSGNFDTLDVSGTSDLTISEIETQLQADGWTTRPSSDAGLTASHGGTAAELIAIDVLADGPDLDITITAPSGLLDLGWAHEWWTEPLNNADIDGTPVRMTVRWQTTGQCDGCTYTRLSVTVEAGGLSVSELADRLATTGNGWTFTEETGWLVVTSPDGQNVSISSELGELSATIESQANITDAVETVEEAQEQSFGDYVCGLLAGEIVDLAGATTWDEFAAPIWADLSADPELADLFNSDPSVLAGHVEVSARERCPGLADSFADGSGRALVQEGYDSTVID